MKGCYRSLLLIFLLISVYGCLEGGGTGVPTVANIGEQLTANSEYTSRERDIAIKICYAFQSKRANFLSSFNGDTFVFDLAFENLDCEPGQESKRIETNLIAGSLSGPMFYDTLLSTNEFVRYLQTTAHGYLVDICTAVMKGDTMPDKIAELGSSTREVIEFVESDDSTGFSYKEYQRDWSQDEEVYLLKSYDYMIVLVDQSDEKYGIVLERVRGKECSNDLVEKKSQFYLP